MLVQQPTKSQTSIQPAPQNYANQVHINNGSCTQFKRNIQVCINQIQLSDHIDAVHNLPTIKTLDHIIEYALSCHASDIHFEPRTETTRVRFRIDGLLQHVIDLPHQIHTALVTRIKIMAELRTDETRVPQDGRIHYETITPALDIRVSIVPTLHGSKATLRLLENKSNQFSLESIGLSGEQQSVIEQQLAKPHGLVLVTGPTGSGKTTTLYTLLQLLGKRDINITTIEDPIEYGMDGVNQIQTNETAGLTFAQGLRSILRQDPDVIMVGEIRDRETAELAVSAAMTGHLVVSSLHTNDAHSTITRLKDMGIEEYLLDATVSLVIAQRLVRKNCIHCSGPDMEMQAGLVRLAQEYTIQLPDNPQAQSGAGCDKCFGTGFSGRVGLYELLDATKHTPSKEPTETTLQQQAVHAVANGITTVPEVLRVINQS